MRNNPERVLLRQHPSQILVMLTDLCEAEQLIKIRAAEAQHTAPEQFAGEEPCVFFRFRYIPPCDDFRELWRLILEVQGRTGLRACFRGIVALEVSEWLGHEQEEYFTIMLKYLFDHRDHWQPVMLLRDCSQSQLQRFLGSCAVYMTPKVIDECLFSNEGRLGEALHQAFGEKGCLLHRDARKLLTFAMMSSDCTKARSLTLIDRVVEDLLLRSGNRKEMREQQVRQYLQDPHSILALLTGKTLSEKSCWKTHGEEIL